MRTRTLYLLLTGIGAVAPMVVFVPWVAAHGLNLRILVAELFANRISTFFAVDLLLTACVVAIYARSADLPARQRWLVILVMVCVGVSAALPLLLYLREKELTTEATAV